MKNTQRIIEAIRSRGPLDDDELSVQSGVLPRQQVNQICRRLEVKGILSRVYRHDGKIVNALKETGGFESARAPDSQQATVTALRGTAAPGEVPKWSLGGSDRKTTLFVICCSGDKASGSVASGGPSILDYLPGSLAERLRHARRMLAPLANLDERTLLPAWRRYSGHFYRAAAQTVARARGEAVSVVIVSGGYGLLLAEERIGLYDRRFCRSDWPEGLLEEVLLTFIQRQGLSRVRAFASVTSDYAMLLQAIPWKEAQVEDAWLFSPVRSRQGAMVKNPRAQGEAFVAFFDERLSENWCSSDDLRIDAVSIA